jgi:hypothetical protein
MKLPDDMHGTALDLAGALVHASERTDTRAEWWLYGELRDSSCSTTCLSPADFLAIPSHRASVGTPL